MDITLVISPEQSIIQEGYQALGWERRASQPLGLAYVAACLRKVDGISVKMIDSNCPISRQGHRTVHPGVEAITLELLAQAPDIIGFSVVSENYRSMLSIARAVKETRPRTLIVIGGHHPTFTWEDILSRQSFIDVVVLGEGEVTMTELARQVQRGGDWRGIAGIAFRQDGRAVKTVPRALVGDLDSLPWPARDLLPALKNYAPVEDPVTGEEQVAGSMLGSRGCSFNCSFCSIHAFYDSQPGAPWRTRRPEEIVREMMALKEDHGAQHVIFWDDTFLLDGARVEALLRRVIAQGLDLSFNVTARADLVLRNAHLLPMLRKAGCRWVEVGIESGSQAVLDRYRKGTTVAQNLRCLELLRKNGLFPIVDFIMFDADTTLDDLEANLQFYRQSGLWGTFPSFRLYTRVALHPGTQALQEMQGRGLAVGDIHDPPGYRFSNPEVADFYAYLLEMRERHAGFRAYLLETKALMRQLRDDAPSKRQAQSRLGLYLTLLKRLPYHAFADLLRLARANELQAVTFEACVEKYIGEIHRIQGLVATAARA